MKPLELGEERPIDNEEAYAQKIADKFKKTLSEYYASGTTKRMFHPKMHGLILAEFIVEKNLPEELKQGIFSEEKTYQAWVRLSNAKRQPTSDRKKDMRGMAIKIVGVEGEKLLEDEKDAVTQDFLLVTAETLQTKSVKDFQKSIDALLDGGIRLFFYAITHISVIIRSLRQITKCSNLLDKQYFSMTPYKFGPNAAVKYSATPCRVKKTPMPDKPSENYLRDQLVKDLAEEDQYFDFKVQLQQDASSMPIEDPTRKWTSPLQKVATIKIPKQSFDSEQQRTYGENLSFTPWHSIEAHRPLGGVNRARKLVYEQIAAFRRSRNEVTDVAEPDSIVTFNE